jgi:phosphoserine phosphatase RsbU/P
MLSEPELRALLLRTLAGRALLVAAAVKVALAGIGSVVSLPAPAAVLDAVATLVILAALVFFTVRLAAATRSRLLWRVRRKLILSYIFIGVVPALLIFAFFFVGGLILFQNLSSYLFKDGYDDVLGDVQLMARTTAVEVGRARAPEAIAEPTLERRRANVQERYPELSLALVRTRPGAPPRARGAPAGAPADGGTMTAGPWRHLAPPGEIPDWVVARGGFTGTIAIVSPDAGEEPELILRSVELLDATPPGHAVVVDLPFEGNVIEEVRERTGIRAGAITLRSAARVRPLTGRFSRPPEAGDRAEGNAERPPARGLFESSVVRVDFVDWETGEVGRAYISAYVRAGDLYNRISAAQPTVPNQSAADIAFLVLIMIGSLFVIIQLVALTMGVALARSITSSVHELFGGTERVRRGDFTHRIAVKARDQLGELASSFNQMTESIEHLLETEKEKKRLEEELRIAREIQMSLLPRGPLAIPGLEITALCVPAREVGGDYYDFFPLDGGRVAVLIADVSGKGTSAALYMAELKGLLLSLSQRHRSPRELLIEANRILADNLDSRSFITMTYAVIDPAARTLTFARAGHTPMIYLPAGGAERGRARVCQPGGLVLGLQIDGVQEKFVALMEEETLAVGPGDVFVMYTDGVTEAMNQDGDLFGDARLGRIVEEHGHLRPAELRERILREVESFAGGADQHDDLTLILIKVVS